MTPNQATIDLIKRFEGFRPNAYRCPAGIWTIGYGHTGDVKEGDCITLTQGEELLRLDLAKFVTGIERLVKFPLNENQFGALVSFAFNVGLGALEKSKLLRVLNDGFCGRVPAQIARWNKVNGVEVAGLSKRREAEINLFLAPVKEAA